MATQFSVLVGFSTHRPVRPDERAHVVTFLWDGTEAEARIFAALWVGARRGVSMVTRADIIDAVL
jgi:hypothetical protein